MGNLAPTSIPYAYFGSGQSSTTVQVRRYSAASANATGRASRKLVATFPLTLFRDPSTGRTSNLSERGRKQTGTTTFYVPRLNALVGAEDEPRIPADEVVMNGRVWKVVTVTRYEPSNGAVVSLALRG